MSEIAWERLDAAGHLSTFPSELLCLPDAGHFAPYPGSPTTGSYAVDHGSYWLILGGTPRGTAHAQRMGLDAIRAFLAESLGSNPG